MGADSPIVLAGPAATEALGRALAEASGPDCVIHLAGDLGAGKTTLARGFLRGLGHEGPVKSPTYSLLEPYDTPAGRVLHLDLYRLADPDEAAWLGLADEQAGAVRLLVEWPERGAGWLPAADLEIRLEHDGSRRLARLYPATGRAPRLPAGWRPKISNETKA